MVRHGVGTAWGGMGWHCNEVTCHWGSMPFGRHGAALHWGSMPLEWHGAAWGGMPFGWHGLAWSGMPLGWHGAALHLGGNATQCIAAHIQVAMGRQHGMAAAMHLGGIAHRQQCTKNHIAAITLAAKHLGENIKNLAFTNPAFTAASHFARISKFSIVKFGNYTGSKTSC